MKVFAPTGHTSRIKSKIDFPILFSTEGGAFGMLRPFFSYQWLAFKQPKTPIFADNRAFSRFKLRKWAYFPI
jgi:hypothetical protein